MLNAATLALSGIQRDIDKAKHNQLRVKISMIQNSFERLSELIGNASIAADLGQVVLSYLNMELEVC